MTPAAAYHRARRAEQAKARAMERAQQRAKQRAHIRLAIAHPKEFQQLLNEEMQRERREAAS